MYVKKVPLKKLGSFAFGILLLVSLGFGIQAPHAAAQTQFVTATPSYINLGMSSTIQVTAPAAGTYSVVVQEPSGSQLTVNVTFTSAGQSQNVTLGSATTGFKSVVNQVGTYNVNLVQGTTVVSSTTILSTNKLNVFMDMVNGGTCAYINGATRGTKMFPRFYVSYASNGAMWTNNTKGAYVTYTFPDGTKTNATWHKPNTVSQSTVGFFIGKYQPNWNDTNVGPWNPTAVIGDAAGNIAVYKYVGIPFVISPVTLSTSITIVNSKTNQTLSGLTNGTAVTIFAVISYPTNAEAVPGFVAPLDSANRGGVVTAQVGWGYYNTTSGAFGSAKIPGGQIGQVTMTYTGKSGIWEGNFSSNAIPTIKTGTAYEVVVSSKDKASPANTGLAVANLGPASGQAVTTSTSGSQTTSSSTSQGTTTTAQEGISMWAYAGTTIALIIGVVVGLLARRPK